MKRQKRFKHLRKRMAETYFLRRGFALLIDFILIGIISIPLYTAFLRLFSIFNPEYKKPKEEIKKIISLKIEDKTLSPVGELLLKNSEKEIEKRIAQMNKKLREKNLILEERKKLKKEIEENEKRLKKIREIRRKAGSTEQPKQRLKKELISWSKSSKEQLEEFHWIEEILVAYIYFTLFFYFFGQTPGKKILGLKVIKKDGSKLSLWNAFERTHGYAYSMSLLFIGFFQVLWDKRSLTMHDKIAETRVIRIKKIKKKKKMKPKKKVKKDKKV